MSQKNGRKQTFPKISKTIILGAIYNGAIVFIFLTIALTLSNNWRLATLAHLRPHLAIISALFMIGFALANKHGWVWAFFFVTVIHSQPLALYTARTARISGSYTAPLHVTHLNIDRDNNTPTAALDHLNQTQPDIIFIQELSPEVAAQLSTALPTYDIVVSQPQTNTRGVGMLLSQTADITLIDSQIITLEPDIERPIISARITYNDQRLHLLSWHTIRPSHEWAYTFQQRTFDSLAQWAKTEQEAGWDVLILGDFNTTPWSKPFAQLLIEGDLHDSLYGRELQNSWAPANTPLWAGLPIDHAIHSENVYTTRRVIGPHVGSDHRPVHINIIITP